MMKGFTLIELMIVVAIIMIIAAIAVPNLIYSKHRSTYRKVLKGEKTTLEERQKLFS